MGKFSEIKEILLENEVFLGPAPGTFWGLPPELAMAIVCKLCAREKLPPHLYRSGGRRL
jgi:hypothetical protein